MGIVITLIIFCIIVIIHEEGHFFAARLSGVTVEEFAVGMGPVAFSFRRGGILYSVRWLPVGGFCRMADTSDKKTDKVGFNDVSALRRIFICIAGPFMNFVLAVAILGFINFGCGHSTVVVDELSQGYPAAEAGIEPGDRIYSINGEKIHIYSDLSYYMSIQTGEKLTCSVIRDGKKLDFVFSPKADENGVYKLGIINRYKSGFLMREATEYKTNIAEAFYCGFYDMLFLVKITVKGLLQLVTASISLDDVAGPIGLSAVVSDVYTQSMETPGMLFRILMVVINMLNITALLSANLGVINLLPIPALDGGKIFLYIIELLRKKPIPPEKEGFINLIGFALIMGLGIVVAFHDVFRLFS